MTWSLDIEHELRGARVVRRYRNRGNGLKVLLLADRAAPVLSYQTWFAVGSAHETPGATGLAHFFEHLMFTGTRSRAQGVFDRMIESCGGDTNAATWLDWTYYRNSIPASELELIVELEADRMHDLVLGSEIVEAEREVILNERRERVDDDVDGFLDEQLMAMAFAAHPYGWPTIGWREDIESLSIAELEAFYRRYYAPSNATLVVVGDFDEQRALDLIEARYGGFPAVEIPELSPATLPPSHGNRHFEKPVPADRMVLGWVGPAQGQREWAILELVSHLLSGGPSSRLYRRLVVELELASSVSCSMLPLRQAGFFEVAVHCNSDHDAGECDVIVDDLLAELSTKAIGADELAKVKAGMLTDFWSDLTTVDGKGESLGHHELVCGDFRELMAFPETVASIDAEEIRATCAALLGPDRKCTVVANPDDSDA